MGFQKLSLTLAPDCAEPDLASEFLIQSADALLQEGDMALHVFS
jgi:hypothetical protein